MTTHSNYSLQNFSTNNAKVLTGNSQPVPDFMALCNQGIISRENISGIDNSNGNLISSKKILGIDNSNNNLPLENEEKVKSKANEMAKAETEAKEEATTQEETEDAKAEAEAKAKGKEVLTKENFNLIKIRLMEENKNLYRILHSKENIDIKKIQRYINLRLKSSRKLYAKLEPEMDQARHRELDSSALCEGRSMLIELLLRSISGLALSGKIFINKQQEEDDANGIDKSQQGQGIVTQDGKSSEQQEQEEILSLTSQLFDYMFAEPAQEQEQEEEFSLILHLHTRLHDLIRTKRTQVITSQDQKEEYDIIKSVQAQVMTAQDCKSEEQDQETDQDENQEIDHKTDQETDQETNQEKDQETDQEENQMQIKK